MQARRRSEAESHTQVAETSLEPRALCPTHADHELKREDFDRLRSEAALKTLALEVPGQMAFSKNQAQSHRRQNGLNQELLSTARASPAVNYLKTKDATQKRG
jgi:hypothetical protein